jgi:hypothetical protein
VGSVIAGSKNVNPIFSVLLVFFCSSRIFNLLSQFPPVIGGDSISYRPSKDFPNFISSYWPETLWGGTNRSILPVTFFHIFPNDEVRFLAMAFISLIGWTYFIYALQSFLQYRNVRSYITNICIFFVVTLGLSPSVTSWNKIIYSESLILTSGIISFGLYFHSFTIKSRYQGVNYGTLVTLAFLISISRTSLIPLFVMLVLSRSIRFYRAPRKPLKVFITLFALLGFISVYLQNNREYFEENGLNRELISISYYISTDNPNAGSFLAFLRNESDIPKCVTLPEAPILSNQQYEWSLPNAKKCPELLKWSQTNFYLITLSWALHNPAPFFAYIYNFFWASASHPPLFSEQSPIPAGFSELISSYSASVAIPNRPGNFSYLGYRFEPFAFFLLMTFSLWIINFKKKPPNSKTKIKKYSIPDISFAGLLVFALLSVVIGIYLLPTTSLEVYRIASPAWNLARVVVFISLFLQIDRFITLTKLDAARLTKKKY